MGSVRQLRVRLFRIDIDLRHFIRHRFLALWKFTAGGYSYDHINGGSSVVIPILEEAEV